VTRKHFILATAGHVDHGKTALIKALTGVDTDRLPEEKVRGITIDLGFAHLALPSTIHHQSATISLGVVDVPGHEDFIRNMIAGVGSIDLALLVIAADDGWMPQTEEHLQILNYLGVRHAVVAITKCDLGDAKRKGAEVREQLRETTFADVPIVLTSVRDSTGLDLLKETLAREFSIIPTPRDVGKPRLFVDRAFTVRGSGTVVTGTLSGGRFSRGETISLQPQNLSVRIRGIQSHNQPLDCALPGTRTALNLPDLRPDQIARGNVITAQTCAQSSLTIDVLIERSGRRMLASHPLKNASVIHVHYGSARLLARVTLLDRRDLLPGDRAIARLRFATPIFAFIGDRFILRDSSGRRTIAGGRVLNDNAEGTKFRAPAERTFLNARATAPNDDLLTLIRTQLRRDGVGKSEALLLKSNFSEKEIATALAQLQREGVLFADGAIVADALWWEKLSRRATDAIDAEHAAHPDRVGMELTQLRAALAIDDPQLFDALVSHLCAVGFARARHVIKRGSHRPSLPPQLQPAGARIRSALSVRPFDPPSRRELMADADSQQALRFLCETGEVLALTEDVILTAEAFAQMKTVIALALRTRGPSTLSELRQVLGTTRRILVPLLECLDRTGLTIRQGDRRALQDHLPAR
jgi:selenocysteine-specific elongation factor